MTMPQPSPSPHGKTRLVITLVTLSATWLILLPWVATQPTVSTYLEWLEEKKIDPSARYYTDLEAMEPILERQNRRRRN